MDSINLLDDLDIIKLSPMFDAEYYYSQRPDVKAANVDAAYHYMNEGWKEHTNPSQEFITDLYLAEHPKINENPLLHYIKSGDKKNIQLLVHRIKQYFFII